MRAGENLSSTTRVIASDTALSTTLDGEAVILETESGTYYGLNDVATQIWDTLDEPRTVAELQESILEQYDIEADRVQRDLESVLSDMAANDLVEFEHTEP